MSGTRTTIEADGIPFFEGEARSIWTQPSAGGGGGGSGITDLRWSDALGGIEAQVAGEWLLKVPFEAFGA